MRRGFRFGLLCGVLLTSAVTLPVVALADKEETYKLLALFGDVFDRVRSDYVEPTKDAELIEAALNGMLTSLDPHSGYMNEKSFKDMQVQTKGEFGGLGIEVTMENGLVKVVSPIDDTPAAEAGIMSGDYVSFIDDEQVMGLTLNEAVDKMRGKIGTDVKLTILREGNLEPMEVTITRANIKIRAGKGRVEGDDIAYLRLTQFNEQTTEQMREEFNNMKDKLPNLRGVVLDLRNNPGGLLDQAISVADAFLSGGEVVSTRERDESKTRRYGAKPGDEMIGPDIPIVVLINGGSASASEIVAGALQDHKRAIVMGTKSFGKGSVQTVIPLPDHGAMRLTTARYYTPAGRSIQAKGIEPDILVQQAKIEPIQNLDKIRSEADLRHRLANPDEKQKKKEQNSSEDDKPDNKAVRGDLDAEEDFQLQRAIDLLRAAHVFNLTAVTR